MTRSPVKKKTDSVCRSLDFMRIQISDPDEKKIEKIKSPPAKRGRKPKKRPLSYSPKLNTSLPNPKINEYVKRTFEKDDAALQSLSKKHKELNIAVESSKQAYFSYKKSQFFHFDGAFMKNYYQGLIQVEKQIKDMGIVLEEHTNKESGEKSTKEKSGLSKDFVVPVDEQPASSLTPPASELGNDDTDFFPERPNQNKRKENSIPGRKRHKASRSLDPETQKGFETSDVTTASKNVADKITKKSFVPLENTLKIFEMKFKKETSSDKDKPKSLETKTKIGNSRANVKLETSVVRAAPEVSNRSKSTTTIKSPQCPKKEPNQKISPFERCRGSDKKSKEASNQKSPSKDGGSETEPEYEVDKVKDFIKKQNGGMYFHVSWKGYSSDEDTFEPAEHLDGCDEFLLDFFLQRLKARKKVCDAEGLKSLLLPTDQKYKVLLFEAFEKLVHPLPEETREVGVDFILSNKTEMKTNEEIQEDILKWTAIRDPNSDRYKKLETSITTQIGYRELMKERLKQLADLRSWENSMNTISSDPARLSVENNVDLALPPIDYVYINDYKPGPNIVIPIDPMAGCECTECGPTQKKCCPQQMNSHFAYNKHGRIRVSLGTPIYECNKACKCPPSCNNRIVQNGRKVSLAIFRTSNGRGWGVKALETIRKDQFVTEYVGEVITSDEAELRGIKYDNRNCTYLFDLDYNKGDNNPYTVDAYKYGNVSHFINHSCDPNLAVYNVWVDCLDPDLPKLALFAVREIRKGEEITFDYNSGSTRQLSIIDKLDKTLLQSPAPNREFDDDGNVIIPTSDLVLKTPKNVVGKTECRCGAANCRKTFF